MTYKLPHPEAKPPRLSKSKVPEELWAYIPLAEKYGISDDSYREIVLDALDKEEVMEITLFLEECEDQLEKWLAGTEAGSSNPTNEYIAFTSLLMAADYFK